MAKITVCDVCLKDKKYVETTRRFTVRRRPELRLDVCNSCNLKVKPLNMTEYKRLVYKCKGYTEQMIETMMEAG